MRKFCVAICAFLACVPAPGSELHGPGKPLLDLTVVLEFKDTWSRSALNEMKQEAVSILKSSGLRLSWSQRGRNPYGAYTHVAFITLRGFCGFDLWRRRVAQHGPFGFSYITGGVVTPFGEVDCDRVAGAVEEALSGHGYASADQQVGRALGRVLAHELVHILTGSAQHTSAGVQKAALTARELIGSTLPLSAADITRLQQYQAASLDQFSPIP